MKGKKKVELLAPAGSKEQFFAAVENGADAVYTGGRFLNARQAAEGLTDEEMEKAVKYAHLRGVKVYVAMNTLVNDSELEDGAEYAGKLLASAVNAPVHVEGSFILNDNIVHKIGSSVLESAWDVLNAGGFIIQIDGRGEIHIRPKPTVPDLILTNNNLRGMVPGIDFKSNISKIPNRYIVISDNNKTVAINNDANSPVSTVNRGFYVDEVDTSPKPVNGETLGAYALGKLEELSCLEEERTYEREYSPDVWLYSIVRASIFGFEGDYRVESQSLECRNGIKVSETAIRRVPLWQRT